MAADGDLVEGAFSLFAMVHTMTLARPGGPQETRPWDGTARAGGPFSYASMPCSGNAPVNNVSTDLPALGGAVPDSRVPVSTRSHPLSFEVVERDRGPGLRGSISLTVCQLRPGATAGSDALADHARPRIEVGFDGEVGRRGAGFVAWSGTFALLGGTGRYEQLRGEGDIAGYFFSFDPEQGAARGALLDGQYAMVGRYRVPAAAAAAPEPP